MRSPRKNFEDLEALVHCLESPPDFLCLTETWLRPSDDENCFLVKGYHQCSSFTRNYKGGGVRLQIKEGINILNSHSVNLEEVVCAEIAYQKFRALILIVYNPPKTNKLDFMKQFDRVFEHIQSD